MAARQETEASGVTPDYAAASFLALRLPSPISVEGPNDVSLRQPSTRSPTLSKPVSSQRSYFQASRFTSEPSRFLRDCQKLSLRLASKLASGPCSELAFELPSELLRASLRTLSSQFKAKAPEPQFGAPVWRPSSEPQFGGQVQRPSSEPQFGGPVRRP
ncbi:hypothetical protein GUJ93_ZPchr0005g15738 [Zizania palustris]|uniref:Uncharacterized protein n=1 Tax=Zizania palustris TaxID=103762 RepID=A0A8J5SCK3_ZIZPA|nr:hypothetical protein GUJ93_ZPchr0005g15738 [Zizania palustris]